MTSANDPNETETTAIELEKASLLIETTGAATSLARRSRWTRGCRLILVLFLSWMGLRFFVQTTARWLIPIHDMEHAMPHRTKSQIMDLYAQNRATKRMGTTDQYVEINTYDDRHIQRMEHMRQLDVVRFGHCGGFQQATDTTATTHWVPHATDAIHEAKHCRNGETYKKNACNHTSILRLVCEAPHPTKPHVTVTIERIGPFRGTGGYDWSVVDTLPDVGMLKERMAGANLTFIGGLAAAVSHNGTILGYPPIHIHHAHVFPIGNAKERGKKIRGSTADHHDIFFQAHGDSECLPEEGGVACLLKQLDDGYGFVVQNSTSGISTDFELNDVRPEGAPPIEYWFEIAVLHTPQPPEKQSATYVGLNNPCMGGGPCTYTYPMDPHNNVMWYQYKHGQDNSQLPNGTMSDFVLHSHQTIFDSAFLIKAPNDHVYEAFERFRGHQRLPLILDCRKDGGTDLEAAKDELLSLVSRHGGTVVCEATKPGLIFLEDDAGEVQVRDKRTKLNCLKDPVDLRVDDRLVVLAFNTVHENKYTRQSKAFRAQNVFSDYYAVYQHSIFRFVLSYGQDVAYAPPSFFAYGTLDLSFFEGIFSDPVHATSTCPSTIQFRMRSGWRMWLNWVIGY